ncbi:MAG TPA: GAF domain-containing protein [Terriglobia bacterium]|jgi:PAS domain S-box-containing protein
MEELTDRYEIIEEAATDAIVTIDEQGRILSISRAAERIFGYSVPEMAGHSVDRIIPNYKQHVEQARRRLKGGTAVEVMGTHKSGKPVQIEFSLGEYNKNNRHIYTGVIRDIASRKSTDQRLAAQYAVTRALAESSSLSEATPKLLQYICEAVGWELGELWVVNADSNTLHIEGSWHLPAYEVEEFEKAGRKTILFPGIDLVGRVLVSSQPAWIDNVVDDKNFPRAPIAERVGLHGAFAFPIRVGEHVACVIAFYNREVVQPDDEMLQMFDALGRQVGDFIKRTRAEEERDKLLIYERVARSEAETNAEKLAFLGEASTVLASSLDYQTNLMTVAKLAVNRLADWCAVDVVDENNGFHRVALTHRDPQRAEWAREFQKKFSSNPAAPHGVAHVMRSGKAKIYTDIPDSMLIALAQDAEHFKILQELGLASAMVVPLVARGRTLGAITLASENPARRYTEADLHFAEELARRAALGIDNARLHSDTQSALNEVRSKTDEIQRLNGELEQRVKERTAQLEMMVKELEAFTYSISDDMRGPLRAIDGFSRVLMEEYPDKMDEEGKRLLNIIRSNARSMSELIDGLLTFSHLGRQPLDQVDINMDELAKNVFEEVQAANKERPVKVEIQKLPAAFGDRTMLRQVLYNLISNSFKFTRPKSDPAIEIGHQAGGNQNTYFIRDNGVGFDMQYSPKLFGVFQRLHSVDDFEGAGVGLALVQRIIHRHGGRVWAEGKVNEGATFYFSIPKA